MFWHDLVNGTGDPFAWHTGCGVRHGTKWTLQKFKETPRVFRVPVAPVVAPPVAATHDKPRERKRKKRN